MATAGSVLSIRDSVLARYASAWPAALAGGLSFGVTLTLAAESGGYFSRTWGFVALALLWIAALGLALRERIRLGRLEQATLAALFGLLLWTASSALWSESAAPPLREANRTVIYVAGLLAVLLVVRSTSYKALLTGAWAAIALACSYALATRLFPERLADAADLVANRLDEPIGYWNALGIFAVLGFLLALGIAARGRGVLLRAAAASSTVILAPTVYFTFGRGPWLALAVGLGAMLALDSRRLQLIATLLVVAPWPSLAVWSSSRFDALTERNPNLAAAADDGRQLAAVVVALAIAAGLAASVLALLEPRVRLSPRTRLVIACALGAAVLAGLGGVFATQGSPVTIAERAYDQLDRPVAPNPDLQGRLFGLSSPGRIAHWRVAWDQYRDSSVIGGAGAGTFERYWLQDQRATGPVRDAHNLYLEMVAELGLVGLALLLVALGVPLLAAVKARRRALVPAAFGAYVAYLVHAGIDWDWEMPAVTLPALLCAGGVLLAARDSETGPISTPVRAGLVAVVVAMMAFAFVGTMGYQALEASEDAEDARQLEKAESEARKAARWLPWSAEPWRALAEVHFDRNDRPQARVALLEALERDSGDWALWYNLGAASDGPARLDAYRKAARLNPLSRNVAVLRTLGLLPPLPSTTESGSSPR